MSLHEWIQLGLIIAGILFQVALAIDRWVHQQGSDGHDLFQAVAKLTKDLDDMHRVLDNGNDRLSAKMSEIQTRTGSLEIEVARLKALDEGRHRAQ